MIIYSFQKQLYLQCIIDNNTNSFGRFVQQQSLTILTDVQCRNETGLTATNNVQLCAGGRRGEEACEVSDCRLSCHKLARCGRSSVKRVCLVNFRCEFDAYDRSYSSPMMHMLLHYLFKTKL